jgi:hypothetical protein
LAAVFAVGCALADPPARTFPSLPKEAANSIKTASADGWGSSSAMASWNEWRGDEYALDGLERFVESPRKSCDASALITYRGTNLRYAGAVTIHSAFRERLERFETVAAEVGARVYGRAPKRVQHFGAYSCRASRGRKHRLSEHALGNAIDVIGFDFGPVKKTDVLPDGVPKQLRGAFQVRVKKHWGANGNAAAGLHARFLRELTDELRARDDIFRGMVGPPDPKHTDHLHFDVAPWRYVRL